MAFLEKEGNKSKKQPKNVYPGWLIAGTWVIAGIMVCLMSFSLYQYFTGKSLLAFIKRPNNPVKISEISSLPNFDPAKSYESVERSANPDTVLPAGSRREVVKYTVAAGDSLFGIANQYEIEPETILWANKDILNDDPHLISIGLDLKIPPVDGILYQWKDGDKLEEIAARYNATVDDILLYPDNNLDMTNPVIEPGSFIMIPNGWRPLKPWVIPVAAGTNAGVNAQIAGPGSCTPSGGNYGTFSFIWPAPYYGKISGNDYWSGHKAIDCMCNLGDPIFASDSGVVIYAGPISGGYGNLVAIDHRNGYLTLYAHLNSISVTCGQSVTQGLPIGTCGSTGNSTGPHLHFEVRQNGGFVNPWHVLQ
ncbi:MAG: peptidoglycan DD-metalloendopeptidase family protein [Anaerolineaceae bacterium]|nr:peptidoglycan DD-metalloendopeptidase family protein [Anaerolineaceae bacterium]